MSKTLKQKQGIQRNKLFRYKLIADYYKEKYQEVRGYITMTEMHRDFIYPKFGISKQTLYTILNTPIERDMKRLEEAEKAQLSMFPKRPLK